MSARKLQIHFSGLVTIPNAKNGTKSLVFWLWCCIKATKSCEFHIRHLDRDFGCQVRKNWATPKIGRSSGCLAGRFFETGICRSHKNIADLKPLNRECPLPSLTNTAWPGGGVGGCWRCRCPPQPMAGALAWPSRALPRRCKSDPYTFAERVWVWPTKHLPEDTPIPKTGEMSLC